MKTKYTKICNYIWLNTASHIARKDGIEAIFQYAQKTLKELGFSDNEIYFTIS